MEPAGLKGGWRSFTTSMFGGGGGGGAVGSGGGGGGGDCLSFREIQCLDQLDSFVSVEDEGPGEDVSLLENRPVDQKKLRKRSNGHTQKLHLDDSDITSSRVTSSIERCQRNKPHPLRHHSNTQPNGHSLSSTSSSSSSFSLKVQPNVDGSAGGGESTWQDDGWTSGTSVAHSAAASAKSPGFEEHSSVQKDVGCLSNRARNSFIDGILFAKTKEPDLGNLIDFDNDGLNN